MENKAPWHLWVVGGLSLLWNGFGCFDFMMTATQNAAYLKPYPQEMLDYWANMPSWRWTAWAIGVFGALLGSAALLGRKRSALILFSASLLGALISMTAANLDKTAPKAEGGLVFSLVIIGIAALLAIYAWWQARRGTLV
ncbi:MAG: hypothetical protein H6847_14655 [Hyphomonas sp.]|nr:hypothetical protein [Hyphomonas sp.]